MKKYAIYALGNALVDTELNVQDSELTILNIDKGVMSLIDANRLKDLNLHFADHHSIMACGGSAANTIIGATQCGANCYFSGRVANDDRGRFYLEDLVKNKVDSNLKQTLSAEGDTGTCFVMVTPDSNRTLNTFLGVSAQFNESNLDLAALKQSEYLYVEGYLCTSPESLDAAIKAKTIAKENDIKIALTLSDPNIVLYFKDQLHRLVDQGVDLLFCNEDEALAFTATATVDAAIEELKNVATTFVVTQGSKGAILYDGSSTIHIQPHSVEAIDTNGAGDSFAGAFLAGITQGLSYESAGNLASFMSAQVVCKFGPRLNSTEFEKVNSFYQKLTFVQ